MINKGGNEIHEIFLSLVDILAELGEEVLRDRAEDWDADATIQDYRRYELTGFTDADLEGELAERQRLPGFADDDIRDELSARALDAVSPVVVSYWMNSRFLLTAWAITQRMRSIPRCLRPLRPLAIADA